MLKSVLEDPSTGIHAKVDSQGQLRVSQFLPTRLPVGTENKISLLTGKLGTEGLNEGTTAQDVDGSTTPQVFYVEAEKDVDLYISQVLIVLADSSVVHNYFGNLSPLAVGWDLFSTESGKVNYLIDKTKTGGDMLLQSGLQVPFGNGTTLNEMINYSENVDAQVTLISLDRFLPPYGLRLGAGTTDRLTSVVNDNLTGLNDMYVRVFGFRHFL